MLKVNEWTKLYQTNSKQENQEIAIISEKNNIQDREYYQR